MAAAERLLLDDDERTLASYGTVRPQEDDGDDIVTLQLVVVAPLTPEQIEARSKEVYEAAEAGDEARLGAAIDAGGADLNWRDLLGWTACFIAARFGCFPDRLRALGNLLRRQRRDHHELQRDVIVLLVVVGADDAVAREGPTVVVEEMGALWIMLLIVTAAAAARRRR